jgi:uncharacterized alkaline shock family protein YloU
VTGDAVISNEVLASYAADAACEVEGVCGLVEGHLPGRRGGVRVTAEDGRIAVELHLGVAWGASIPAVGAQVQRRVSEYLVRMADIEPSVDVVVDEVVVAP